MQTNAERCGVPAQCVRVGIGQTSSIFLVEVWILLSVLAGAAGWILSAAGQLNRTGYIVFFAVAGVLIWIFRTRLDLPARFNGKKLWRRFRRPLPVAFALLAFLVFLSGVLYPATTHTALTYHIPRVLHWLAAEKWHWIYTPVTRMNHSGCGMEWLIAPLLLFTGSDRGIFLLNFFPFLLLPGLIFSVCIQLGVRTRVAWHWMWLFPTGYNFLLQSSSAGNDTFAAVYALAMVYFGLRARISQRSADLWLCILSTALLTSVKASNLPLILVAGILVVANWSLLRNNWRWSSMVLLLAALVSFLPMAIMNKLYCGDWLGTSIEVPHLEMHKPLIGLLGNSFQLLLNNFVPPFFVLAGWWNQHAALILPHSFVTAMENNFDIGFFWLGELPTEDWAGIGFGVSMLLTISVLASFALRQHCHIASSSDREIPAWLRYCVLVAPWAALLAYCVKSGLVTAARLISPYYALLLPLLLIPAGHAWIIRQRWWRCLMWMVIALAVAVAVVVPGRPLWPAQIILSASVAAHPGQPLLARAARVYAVYGGRSDPLAQVRALLPADVKVVGFMGTPDDIDISLWRPYGTRRVEHFLVKDSAEQIRARGIHYAVVSGLNLEETGTTLEAWLAKSNAELVATTNAVVKVSDGPRLWHIVRFKN